MSMGLDIVESEGKTSFYMNSNDIYAQNDNNNTNSNECELNEGFILLMMMTMMINCRQSCLQPITL